jgi:hypothetical protein
MSWGFRRKWPWTTYCLEGLAKAEKSVRITISPNDIADHSLHYTIPEHQVRAKLPGTDFIAKCSVCLPTYLHVTISCCSHFEHRTSVKLFVSLQFINFGQLVGLHERGIRPAESHYLHRTTQTELTQINIHAMSGIWTHDPSVRAGEDISCVRLRGNCDRQIKGICNELVN